MEKIILVIANANTNELELLEALMQLGPVTEPPSFWTTIANSPEYRKMHRRKAIEYLFRRHIPVGINLGRLADTLSRPTWLQEKDVYRVDELSGKIPVKWSFDNSVFVLHILPGPADDSCLSIYLSASGKIERDAFTELLLNNFGSEELRETTVLEIAYFPSIK